LRKGIQMKRCLAFALIAVIGMFIVGCGGGETKPPTEFKKGGGGFSTGDSKTKTPAAPGATNKTP
jgi:hypothetical protein